MLLFSDLEAGDIIKINKGNLFYINSIFDKYIILSIVCGNYLIGNRSFRTLYVIDVKRIGPKRNLSVWDDAIITDCGVEAIELVDYKC